MTLKSPRVFVSYGHGRQDDADRVLALADRLRSDGVDAILDQYEDAPAEGWPKWTERQIRESDFVLIICTKSYKDLLMGTPRPSHDIGVSWESTLTYQHIYEAAGADKSKFIPVILSGSTVSDIPQPLRHATYFDLRSGSGYLQLYRRLTDQPHVRKIKSQGLRTRNRTHTAAVIVKQKQLDAIRELSASGILSKDLATKFQQKLGNELQKTMAEEAHGTKSKSRKIRVKVPKTRTRPKAIEVGVLAALAEDIPERGFTKRRKFRRPPSHSRSVRNSVCDSYSHKDREWLEQLRTMLTPLTRYLALRIWDDTAIKAGTNWKNAIKKAISEAAVAVLLVSPDFLASEFIAKDELPPLLKAAESKGLTVIWIPVRASLYDVTPIGEYQAGFDPTTPLDSLSRADVGKAFVEIAQAIKKAMGL